MKHSYYSITAWGLVTSSYAHLCHMMCQHLRPITRSLGKEEIVRIFFYFFFLKFPLQKYGDFNSYTLKMTLVCNSRNFLITSLCYWWFINFLKSVPCMGASVSLLFKNKQHIWAVEHMCLKSPLYVVQNEDDKYSAAVSSSESVFHREFATAVRISFTFTVSYSISRGIMNELRSCLARKYLLLWISHVQHV